MPTNRDLPYNANQTVEEAEDEATARQERQLEQSRQREAERPQTYGSTTEEEEEEAPQPLPTSGSARNLPVCERLVDLPVSSAQYRYRLKGGTKEFIVQRIK